jgi:quercetin dioxygenase-like cupin family protein
VRGATTRGDDVAATTVRRVDKPWGYELIWAHTGRYVGKILHINAGAALSYQYHRVKEETIYVLRGVLTLHVSDDDSPPRVLELGEGAAFHITPGLRHRFQAKADVDLLEASTPELDDVVRLEDLYGRAGR